MDVKVNRDSVIGIGSRLIIPTSRIQALLTAALTAVIAGALFPHSARIFDVLLIFSLSLTAATLIITFSARGALEVSGFPSLIALATMLHIAISAASCRQIISQDSSSTISSFFGSIVIRNNGAFAILAFVVLMIITFGVIYKAVKNIRDTSGEFITNIVPIKQIGIESDFNSGIIDELCALALREEVRREAIFFNSMACAGRFILCAAVVEAAIAVVNIFGGAAAYTTTQTSNEATVKAYSAVIGTGMATQLPALLIAAASSYLVRKSCISAVWNNGGRKNEFAKRIKVVANEMMPQKPVELRNGNALSLTEDKTIVKDAEWCDESQRQEDTGKTNNSHKWLWNAEKGKNYYDATAELIRKKTAEGAKTILMAAENITELPVTVPVNIAMRLAEKKQECLLIDLDFERGAISKVFDIDQRDIKEQEGTIGTCISGLQVFAAARQMKSCEDKSDKDIKTIIIQAIEKLEGQYDCLIVYAPNTKLLGDRSGIVGHIRAAMLFGSGNKNEASPINKIHKILTECGCEILKASDVPAESQ